MHNKGFLALMGPPACLWLLLSAAPILAASTNPAEAPNPNDPSVSEVYAAARAGHLDQARQMMNQVLANHPSSARAHYVAAELDADMKNLGEARQEFKRAEDLNPGLPFANPQAVAALREQIGVAAGSAANGALPGGAARGNAVIVPARTPAHFPWLIVWIVAGVVFLLWLTMRRRAAVAPAYYPGTLPNTAMGPGGVVPPAGGFPSVVGGGPGIMGGIASGLAVGAGVAAGEELIQRAFDGNRGAGTPLPESYAGNEPPEAPPNAEMGGPDFGIADGGGWNDGGGSSSGDDGGGDWT